MKERVVVHKELCHSGHVRHHHRHLAHDIKQPAQNLSTAQVLRKGWRNKKEHISHQHMQGHHTLEDREESSNRIVALLKLRTTQYQDGWMAGNTAKTAQHTTCEDSNERSWAPKDAAAT